MNLFKNIADYYEKSNREWFSNREIYVHSLSMQKSPYSLTLTIKASEMDFKKYNYR